MKTVHYFVLGLGALSAACAFLASADASLAPLCHAVSAIAATLGATLGVLSPSALAAPPVQP